MIRTWRLTRSRFAATAFDGIGSERVGGRWSPRGLRVAYTSSSIALCVLETLVHLDFRHLPKDYIVIEALIPNTLASQTITTAELPSDWRSYPAPSTLQTFGRDWVERNTSAVLWLPSALVPTEMNAMLNPQHPDFTQIELGKPQPFEFDARLFGRVITE